MVTCNNIPKEMEREHTKKTQKDASNKPEIGQPNQTLIDWP
jgi:hypothetical protein